MARRSVVALKLGCCSKSSVVCSRLGRQALGSGSRLQRSGSRRSVAHERSKKLRAHSLTAVLEALRPPLDHIRSPTHTPRTKYGETVWLQNHWTSYRAPSTCSSS